MKCILSRSKDPFFNLAAEEYLLKHFEEDIYFQYINSPSVIIGKHQNALSEVHLEYLEKKHIMLARRITGGGAVFHDEGNINYSFITNEIPGDFIQFKKYTQAIIAYLKKHGVNATLGKRNELLAGDKKISGTASHVFKRRVLHHGTLLFNTDLSMLSKCLNVKRDRYIDKAVKSISSEVINLKDMLDENMDVASFTNLLFQDILNSEKINLNAEFSEKDTASINTLREEKFSRWEWNFGYSPKYIFERSASYKNSNFLIKTSVNKGRIDDISIDGNLPDADFGRLVKKLIGINHSREIIKDRCLSLSADKAIIKLIMDCIY